MEEQELTYEQACERLKAIISKMENGQMQIDELSENIKQAEQMISFCKDKLKKVEVDVEKLIADIEKQNIE